MNCTQKQQLVCFPKVRVYKPWFRHFNDHKDFRNEGTVHLFSLMALFSYANFRSNERVIYGDRYMEAPGQWICKLGALPRILRVHSKAQALELMEYFRNHGFLTFEILDEEKEILRFTIADWKEHCTHLQYNYYGARFGNRRNAIRLGGRHSTSPNRVCKFCQRSNSFGGQPCVRLGKFDCTHFGAHRSMELYQASIRGSGEIHSRRRSDLHSSSRIRYRGIRKHIKCL